MSEKERDSGQEAAPPEGRNLVICCDGTANVPKAGGSSNVFRLVRLLRGHPDKQRIYYDPGLGTESAPSAQTIFAKTATKVLGLAFGYGLSKNIADAYTYLMNHYQPGDRIYMFGFSRGAYTVRAVAGMLQQIGLLEEGSDNLLYYAIRRYTQQGKRKWADDGAFKGTLCRQIRKSSPRFSVPVHFLGVWDTVKSVGLFRRSIILPHTDTLPNVVSGRHAVSLDEKRSGYRNNMWSATGKARGDCRTVWFSGVHSDVGGSYGAKERGLADIALEWMLDGAERHGLIIDRDGFVSDRDRRRGLVRVERAQELALESKGQWKELAGELGDTLAGAKSWTKKLQARFGQDDVKQIVAALEDDVGRRFERSHNPLIPFWWILGWWRRGLPQRAWIHRSVVRRIGRMTQDEQRRLEHPLDLLTRIGSRDFELTGSVLVAQSRQNGQLGDVLIQTLNQGEAEALRQNPPPSAAAATLALRARDIELWQQELARQLSGSELSQKKQDEHEALLASIAEAIAARRIKGDDGAFAKIKAFFRKKALTLEQKDRIIDSAPYLIESLAEEPWLGDE